VVPSVQATDEGVDATVFGLNVADVADGIEAVRTFAPTLLLGVKVGEEVPVEPVVAELGETVPLPVVTEKLIGAPEIPKLLVVARVSVGLHAGEPAVKDPVWHESLVEVSVKVRVGAAPTAVSTMDGPR